MTHKRSTPEQKELLPEFQAPTWEPDRSEYLVLWHGTTNTARKAIETGIDLTRCAVNTDFGRGLYLTTLERQARLWAWKQVELRQTAHPRTFKDRPVVLRFRVRRFTRPGKRAPARDKGLDSLKHLGFVRATHDNEDFWSLVQHCRASTPPDSATGRRAVIHDHRRGASGRGWYDVVSGPVAAFWEQRVAMAEADQYSFHTTAAVAILDDLIRASKEAKDTGSYSGEFVT